MGFMRTGCCNGRLIETLDGPEGDVVDESEIANHVAVVENIDGFPLRDGVGKEYRRHVGASPRAIDGEEAQSCRRYAVELAVAVCDEFVRLLAGRIETDGDIGLVVL